MTRTVPWMVPYYVPRDEIAAYVRLADEANALPPLVEAARDGLTMLGALGVASGDVVDGLRAALLAAERALGEE